MKTVLASIVLGCCVFAGRFLSVTCRRSPVHHRRRVGDPCASSDDTTANARSQTFSLKKITGIIQFLIHDHHLCKNTKKIHYHEVDAVKNVIVISNNMV